MTFADWFEAKWRKADETTTDALQRLSASSGISYKTLFYAWKGCRTTPSTAKRIETLTGGAVKAGDLVLLPTRKEMGVGKTGTDD